MRDVTSMGPAVDDHEGERVCFIEPFFLRGAGLTIVVQYDEKDAWRFDLSPAECRAWAQRLWKAGEE